MYTTINSFSQIEQIEHNSLIICDIDDTLLFWNKTPEDFIPMIKSFQPFITELELKLECEYWLSIYINTYNPEPTDKEGFDLFLQKIRDSNSKLLFLTARNQNSQQFTEKNFKAIGLEYHDYDIYYTNNIMTKGEYIKNNFNITPYKQLYFIDDYETNIYSIKQFFPNSQCYKFIINSYFN